MTRCKDCKCKQGKEATDYPKGIRDRLNGLKEVTAIMDAEPCQGSENFGRAIMQAQKMISQIGDAYNDIQAEKKREQARQDIVKFELAKTNVFTRWPCTVCGAYTKNAIVSAEVKVGKYAGRRICETCLKGGDLDGELIIHSNCLFAEAEFLRDMAGLIEAPTYDEWKAEVERVGDERRNALIPEWAR